MKSIYQKHVIKISVDSSLYCESYSILSWHFDLSMFLVYGLGDRLWEIQYPALISITKYSVKGIN